jgi:hypothetical protein
MLPQRRMSIPFVLPKTRLISWTTLVPQESTISVVFRPVGRGEVHESVPIKVYNSDGPRIESNAIWHGPGKRTNPLSRQDACCKLLMVLLSATQPISLLLYEQIAIAPPPGGNTDRQTDRWKAGQRMQQRTSHRLSEPCRGAEIARVQGSGFFGPCLDLRERLQQRERLAAKRHGQRVQ